MSNKPLPNLVIVGAGGHARVVVDAIKAHGVMDVAAILSDRDEDIGQFFEGVTVSGPIQPELERWAAQNAKVHVAIGDNQARRGWCGLAQQSGAELFSVLHPTACVSPSAKIESGVYLGPFSAVNAASRIEQGCIINTGAIVEHDCSIGAFAHLGPGACLTGHCRAEELSFLGARSVAIPHRTIGARAIVGAGSVVTEDVRPDQRVVGAPAR